MQHFRERHIDREADGTGDLGPPIWPRKRFTNDAEFGVGRQRLVDGHLPLYDPNSDARDAIAKRFAAQNVPSVLAPRHDHPLRAWEAASVAAMTCG